jgi:hypothetical protein
MNISTFLGGLIIISSVFFLFAQMGEEAKIYYPNAAINDSEWSGKYDYVGDINNSVGALKKPFDDIGDEQKGWFVRITSGITSTPSALLQIPILVGKSFSLGGSLIFGILSTFGIPTYIVLAFTALLIIWGIFKMVEIYSRWKT